MYGRGGYNPLRIAHPEDEHFNQVRVLNTTGADVDAYSVLGITGTATPFSAGGLIFQLRPVFKGVTPASATHSGRFVIVENDLRANRWGWGFIAGACPVQVLINSTADRFAEVNDGDVTQLTSGSSGSAQIIDPPSATGTQWCWVRIGNGC
jgi:hypothetical protein